MTIDKLKNYCQKEAKRCKNEAKQYQIDSK